MEIFFFSWLEKFLIKAAFLEIPRLNQTPKAIPGNFVGIFKLGGQTASMQICVLGHIFKAILQVQTGEENFQEYPSRSPADPFQQLKDVQKKHKEKSGPLAFQVVLLSEVPSTRSSWELTWH